MSMSMSGSLFNYGYGLSIVKRCESAHMLQMKLPRLLNLANTKGQ